jgi:hypothetical protein
VVLKVAELSLNSSAKSFRDAESRLVLRSGERAAESGVGALQFFGLEIRGMPIRFGVCGGIGGLVHVHNGLIAPI